MNNSKRFARTLGLLLLGLLCVELFSTRSYSKIWTSESKDAKQSVDVVDGANRGDDQQSGEPSDEPLVIRVNAEKRRAAGVEVGKITTGPWTDSVVLPAKLELDPDRHFAITAPVDVIVEDLLFRSVHPSKPAVPLLRLSAPEITQLRGQLEPAKPN